MSDGSGLRIEVGRIGARVLLTLRGAITFESAPSLEEQCRLAAPGHGAEVILDMRGVPLMDSAALELLLTLHEHLESQGGRLTLVQLSEVCADILRATRLGGILHVYGTLEQATGGG